MHGPNNVRMLYAITALNKTLWVIIASDSSEQEIIMNEKHFTGNHGFVSHYCAVQDKYHKTDIELCHVKKNKYSSDQGWANFSHEGQHLKEF